MMTVIYTGIAIFIIGLAIVIIMALILENSEK